jgi:hypothetical protein
VTRSQCASGQVRAYTHSVPRKSTSAWTETIDLVVLVQPSRSISDDHWEEIDASHIEVWEKADSLFKSYAYDSEKRSVRIEFDWKPIVRRLRQHLSVMRRIHAPDIADKYRAYSEIKFPRRPVRVNCTVTVTRKKDKKASAAHVALFDTESFLYDMFLILNLAAPGCCSFWSATLKERQTHPSWAEHPLSLSEYSFDLAFLGSYEGKWPAPRLLDLEEVHTWYRSVRSGLNQIPENRAQKVLFALMHIAKAELSLATIIWLFYALETLYDTQPGENRRALTHRIGLVLSPDDKQKAYLKKELRDLYDIRSGFAHGGREIAHPMNNEAVDERVSDEYRKLMDASEFGFTVVLTSIQHLIEKGISDFTFQEALVDDRDRTATR